MNQFAFVTTAASLPDDYDMPLLLQACEARGVHVDVCDWHDPEVDWKRYVGVVLRSPWDYTEQLPDFLRWCERITYLSRLFNPLPAVRWSLDKHYLADLAIYGVPIVPTEFIEIGESPEVALRDFLCRNLKVEEFVLKPTVGCYSKGVQRFTRRQECEAAAHVVALHQNTGGALLQPYELSIDREGETNLIYFHDQYSHAIRKSALLAPDGTVHVPSYDFRSAREASDDEKDVALAALKAARQHLKLAQPLLYARVDLIRGAGGKPHLLELEIAEPSLSLPLSPTGAMRFADALTGLLANARGN